MFPASGGFRPGPRSPKVIRFALHGCTNRPFFHIVLMTKRSPRQGHVIEQLGTYDPMENAHGEKLVAFNTERINYWYGRGATITKSCSFLLGLSGLFPIHPHTYMVAWRKRNRAKAAEEGKGEA